MPADLPALAHRLQTLQRLYVATTPEWAELSWQSAASFDQIPIELKAKGHFYRFPGLPDLIHYKEDGSGQTYLAGEGMPDIDPSLIIDIPAGAPAPTLLTQMLDILSQAGAHAPNQAQIEEMAAPLKDLPSPDRAARLAKNFQATLATVPPIIEHQLAFLAQAAQQVVGPDLLACRTRGFDAAGALLIEAVAKAAASVDRQRCSNLLTQCAQWSVSCLDELGASLIKAVWPIGLGIHLPDALDEIRHAGEVIIESAREGRYPEGHPEQALDIYYGMILLAVAHLLATHLGYYLLSKSPAEPAQLKTYAKRASTAEEKFIRLQSALLYAVQDLDSQRLAEHRAEIAEQLAAGNQEGANQIADRLIDLQFFYPPIFRSVLLTAPTGSSH